ncbi:MAG: rhodanese-like domain-containing protein [Firmicutes bacterium]|nr:rhodanese-like domain-containing protein [Bacillota bacterium]
MFGFNFKANYKSMTADEVKTALGEDKNIILLDVRTREEYKGGHIPGSMLIPLDELGNRAAGELKNKEAKIIVYCRSGGRSASASNILANLGYTNVCNMMGGIMSWKYEVE